VDENTMKTNKNEYKFYKNKNKKDRLIVIHLS